MLSVNMAKRAEFERGCALVEKFCTANKIETPFIANVLTEDWRYGASCGVYEWRTRAIYVCVNRCAALGRGGRAWSWPGYVVDRTGFGVVAHELGHHLEHVGGPAALSAVRMRRTSGERPLTGYAPNDSEWLAEMVRLFITNPDLLRLVRPRTYFVLCAAGLRPLRRGAWRRVLRGAPARTVAMAARKIERAAP